MHIRCSTRNLHSETRTKIANCLLKHLKGHGVFGAPLPPKPLRDYDYEVKTPKILLGTCMFGVRFWGPIDEKRIEGNERHFCQL